MSDEKLSFVSEALENYCIEHSNPISNERTQIEKHTRAHVPFSMMLTGALEGEFLAFLIRLTRAKRVLEFGTYTGYSALSMAEALPSDGQVITLDIDEKNTSLAREFWAKSKHGKKIQLVLGPASKTTAQLQKGFDLVFIDADKPGYTGYLEVSLKLLSPNGLIVVDNCLFSGEVLTPHKATENGRAIIEFNKRVLENPELDKLLLPIRDGVYLIRKKETL